MSFSFHYIIWLDMMILVLYFLFYNLKILLYLLYCDQYLVTSVMSDPLWPYGLEPTRLLCPQDSPGKNTGLGFHFLLQGSSQPRDRTHISCISCSGRWILDCWCHLRGTDYQVVWVQKDRQLVITDGGHIESWFDGQPDCHSEYQMVLSYECWFSL